MLVQVDGVVLACCTEEELEFGHDSESESNPSRMWPAMHTPLPRPPHTRPPLPCRPNKGDGHGSQEGGRGAKCAAGGARFPLLSPFPLPPLPSTRPRRTPGSCWGKPTDPARSPRRGRGATAARDRRTTGRQSCIGDSGPSESRATQTTRMTRTNSGGIRPGTAKLPVRVVQPAPGARRRRSDRRFGCGSRLAARSPDAVRVGATRSAAGSEPGRRCVGPLPRRARVVGFFLFGLPSKSPHSPMR